jgi:hypothetical protein
MTGRIIALRGSLLLGVMGITLSNAQAADSVTVLQPVRYFQVHEAGALRLSDVAIYNGDLFLLLVDPNGSNEILRVSGNGAVLGKITLPAMQRYQQLRVSQSGTLAVSSSHFTSAPSMTVLLYDPGGGLKTSFDAPLFNEIAFIGDDLVGVDGRGITQLTSQSAYVPYAGSLPLVLSSPYHLLMTVSLAQNRLAIVEPISGRLQIASMNSVLVAPMVLYAPEIQEVERPYVGDGVLVALIQAVAANAAGDLFVGPSGAKRQEGSPVLRLDSFGRLKNRYKCILPTFGQDPSVFDSYMYASKLLATNDSLFWVSRSEKKFAEYSIESSR